MQPELLIEYEWAGETIKHIGSAVHRIIQWIAEEGLAAWSPQRVKQEQGSFLALLTQLGVPGEDMEQSLAQVSQAISQLIDDERGRWILSDAHHDAHNEYSISGLHDGKVINAILDRTFIDDKGVRWVIDYKTSRHEGKDMETFLDREQERYQQQLEAYGSLLRHMGDEPVRLALYFPLLQGWREWAMP
ncbi:MAG: PD-(D/E)XK nuclease family protein, partial [Gammaproteobacteria bacterium]